MENKEGNQIIKVKETIQLLDFLLLEVKGSRNKIKSLLRYKRILVNKEVVSIYDYQLKKNDEITILKAKFNKEDMNFEKNIIYEDDEFLVINKKEGVLSVSTLTEKQNTVFHLSMNYIKKKNISNRVFIVHRLDRETSGILLMSKNKKTKLMLQDNWSELVLTRKYYALVEGILSKKEDTLISWLNESKTQVVYSNKLEDGGKKAITKYKVIKEANNYSLLEVEILTGRKNQIRVQLSDIGHPVVGDKKYKAITNPIGRMGLHAFLLEVKHPYSKQVMSFNANMPVEFIKLF